MSFQPRWCALDVNLFETMPYSLLSSLQQVCYIHSIAWTTKMMTDGHLTKAALHMMGANTRTADALVKAGLWTVAEDGWQITDWHKWQKSRGEWARTSERRSEVGKQNMCKRWHSDSCRCTEGHAPIKKLRIVGDGD